MMDGNNMGWNEAYTILESAVINAYDPGKLDEPYRNSDIDHGGANYLQTTDGLLCDEIIVKILRPDIWEKVKGLEQDERDEVISDSWYKLTRKEFGYW
jgi:hypothetical protein